jgi:hypothetical protein
MVAIPLKLIQNTQENKLKPFVSPYEFCLYEFLESITEEISLEMKVKLKVQTEVSLTRLLCSRLGNNLNQIIPDFEMRNFAYSCSSIDMAIFLYSDNFYPLMAIEKQGKYHSDPQQQHRDKLKMKLLDLADITLLWEDSPRIGLMEFITPPSEIFCQVNPYNNQGRNKFKDKLKIILEDYLETEHF